MKTEEEEKQKETPNSPPGIMRKAFIGSIILCVISGSTYFIYEQMWLFSMSITFGTIAFHLGIRYLSPVILYFLFHKKYNYENVWFRQKSWEPGIYQFLKVKTWKSHILSYNADEFSMKKHSLEEIVNNMCHAEAVHELVILLGFLSLLAAIPFGAFSVFFITAVIAGAAECIFVFLQRYNRPRVVKLLNKQNESAINRRKSR